MPASPYAIAGNLNFGSVPDVNSEDLGYGTSYQNALELNKQNYNNILGGYQQLMSGQMTAQQAIANGYQSLTSATLGDIADVGAAQSQAIRDAYAAQSGQTAQRLISSGLGNTTVQGSMQRGLLSDKSKADIELANKMAQLTAGYRSQLGLAGLNQANASNMQNTALGNQQLGFMERVNATYPGSEYMDLLFKKGLAKGMRGAGGFGAGGIPTGGVPMQAQRQQGSGFYRPPPRASSMGGEQGGGGYMYGGQRRGGGEGGQPQTVYGQGYDPGNMGDFIPVYGSMAGLGLDNQYSQVDQYGDLVGGYGGGGPSPYLAGGLREVPYEYGNNFDTEQGFGGTPDGPVQEGNPADFGFPNYDMDQTQGWNVPDFDYNFDQTQFWDVPQEQGGGGGGTSDAWWQQQGLTGNEAASGIYGAGTGFGGGFEDYWANSYQDYGGFDNYGDYGDYGDY